MGTALRRARATGATSVATIVHGAGIAGLDAQACAQAIAEGAVMGTYRFRRYKYAGKNGDGEENNNLPEIETLTIVENDKAKLAALRKGVERGVILGTAANHTRDLANEPANELPPIVFAERAQALAKEAGLRCEVLNDGQLKQMGMGALLGVGVGSTNPPRFIIIKYEGDKKSKKTLGLLGKGITFDSGGISIKPAAGMESMKGDMSGGAAVIATMWALGKLKPRINVTAMVPTAENMPSGSATKPGDVVKALNGKTIEVINTDAEGRLILADAICYAKQQGLSPLVDVATLTGAMMVALGPAATGFFSTEDKPGGADQRGGREVRRVDVALPAPAGIRREPQKQRGGHQEHRQPFRRRHQRGGVHALLRRGHALGAHRHGRHRRVRQGEGRLGKGLDRDPDADADQLPAGDGGSEVSRGGMRRCHCAGLWTDDDVD